MLVEVKSHNDQLSEKQLAWLAVFNANGVDARVFKVKDKGGKRKKSASVSDGESDY